MYKVFLSTILISYFSIDYCFAFNLFEKVTGFVGITESCYQKWIPADINGLREDLETKVYGQPFLISTLIPVLKYHYTQGQNNKALAISFHGSPGVGKNFVVELIAKNIYKKGFDSKFFNFFSGLSDFPRTEKDYYKEFLRDKIIASVSQCEWSMFVFDETDKMPDGLLDVVKSYLDVGRRVDGVDFRKAVFIFLSNIGERLIIDQTLSLWKTRISRNQFKLKQFQDILFAATFNEKVIYWRDLILSTVIKKLSFCLDYVFPQDYFKEYTTGEPGGLKFSATVRNALINLYLPFLPLEREHVQKCIIAEAERNNVTADGQFINKIIAEIDFGPVPEKIFASHGCKQIDTKVILLKEMLMNDFMRYNDEL